VVVKRHVKEVVEPKLRTEMVVIICPCQTMAMDVAFRIIGEGKRIRKRWDVVGIYPAQVRVVGRISIKAVLVDWVCAVSVVIIGLSIATKAAHDGIVVALRQGWESSHDCVCSLIVAEIVDIIALCGALE